jgi:protease-4
MIMKWLKTMLFRIAFGLAFVILGPASFGAENAAPAKVPSTPSVVAHFHLSGRLTESPVVDPFGLTAGQVTSLADLVDRLEQASVDGNVKAVILTYDGMSFGFGQLEELRKAVGRVKAAGKKVYVHAEMIMTFPYALLCAADHLSLAPESSLWLMGLYGEGLYIKGLLDKISVEADMMHMGAYKSAGELFARTGPSEEVAENINWIFDSYYDSLVDMIAASRDKTPETVRKLIDKSPYLAEEALTEGLIDAIETREEFVHRVRDEIEGSVKVDNRYGRKKGPQINMANPLALFSILAEMFTTHKESQKDAVAVIYVEGPILPGHNQSGLFGSVSVAFSGDIRKALEKAVKDDSIKAVVMRVNSPGGSAMASEVILNATRQARAGKPFIVSMGNVAASGGYYISCAAETIFADQATITASIGVAGGKLITKGMWDKLGINWMPYKRGARGDIFNSNRLFNDDERALLERYMRDVYEVFKGHVAKGRGDKLTKPVEQMAAGRVYTGKQALALGLVDQIGGLHEAIEYAAARASLDDYEIRTIPKPLDFITQMMQQFSGEGERPTDISFARTTSILTRHPELASLFEILQKTEPQRARALYHALLRLELISSENVIMMMPFDVVLH